MDSQEAMDVDAMLSGMISNSQPATTESEETEPALDEQYQQVDPQEAPGPVTIALAPGVGVCVVCDQTHEDSSSAECFIVSISSECFSVFQTPGFPSCPVFGFSRRAQSPKNQVRFSGLTLLCSPQVVPD